MVDKIIFSEIRKTHFAFLQNKIKCRPFDLLVFVILTILLLSLFISKTAGQEA